MLAINFSKGILQFLHTSYSLWIFSAQSGNKHLFPALIKQHQTYVAFRSFKIYISRGVVRFEPLLLWHSEARKFHGPQLKVFCVFMDDSDNAELALVVMGAILLRSDHLSDREWRESILHQCTIIETGHLRFRCLSARLPAACVRVNLSQFKRLKTQKSYWQCYVLKLIARVLQPEQAEQRFDSPAASWHLNPESTHRKKNCFYLDKIKWWAKVQAIFLLLLSQLKSKQRKISNMLMSVIMYICTRV